MTRTMTTIAVSRQQSARNGSLRAGRCCALPGPASASALGGQNLTNGEVARKWYASWEKRDEVQCSVLKESWIARRNNTQWIGTFRP